MAYFPGSNEETTANADTIQSLKYPFLTGTRIRWIQRPAVVSEFIPGDDKVFLGMRSDYISPEMLQIL